MGHVSPIMRLQDTKHCLAKVGGPTSPQTLFLHLTFANAGNINLEIKYGTKFFHGSGFPETIC